MYSRYTGDPLGSRRKKVRVLDVFSISLDPTTHAGVVVMVYVRPEYLQVLVHGGEAKELAVDAPPPDV